MILQIKASVGFVNEPVPKKILLGGKVVAGVTASTAVLINLPVPIATLQKDTDSVQSLAILAESGDHTDRKNLNDAVKTWNDDFRQTANYVSLIANGSASIITAAGFTPTDAESTPTPELGQCENFKAAPETDKGTFVASCHSMHTAAAYVVSAATGGVTVTKNGDTLIFTVGTETIYVTVDTHPQIHVENVQSKVPLNVTMFAVNRAGAGPLSGSQEVTPQ